MLAEPGRPDNQRVSPWRSVNFPPWRQHAWRQREKLTDPPRDPAKRSVAVAVGEGDVEGLLGPAAHDGDLDLVTGRVVADRCDHARRAVDRRAVDGHDDVAVLDAGVAGRRVDGDVGDQGTLPAVGAIVERDTEEP